MDTHPMLQAVFWLTAGLIAYTFVGYPLLIILLARLSPRGSASLSTHEPSVTVVLAAHNEESRITERIQNLLASDYPRGKLDIVVVSDGSTDQTVSAVEALAESRVRLIAQPVRLGKSACLNVGCAAARGDIIVFADVRQRFAPDTIRQLVRHFAAAKVGAVSGELEIAAAQSSVGAGVDAYWRLEKLIRFHEAQLDSCVGCTGAVYALRRQLFEPLPPDTILDDVVIPMRIAVQGYRIGFEPAARAFDPQPLDPQRERIRKQRTLAGNYQMLFRHPAWLLPWRNRLWWQLLSHKYLRLGAPFFLLGVFMANLALVAHPFYRLLLFGQCAFYALALGGAVLSDTKWRILSAPAGFVFLNVMSARGLGYFLFPPRHAGWQPTPAKAQPDV